MLVSNFIAITLYRKGLKNNMNSLSKQDMYNYQTSFQCFICIVETTTKRNEYFTVNSDFMEGIFIENIGIEILHGWKTFSINKSSWGSILFHTR